MLSRLHPSLSHLQVVLASQSPRRAEICEKLGLSVVAVPTGFLEDLDWKDFDSPEAYCIATAEGKHTAFLESNPSYDIVVCADSIVACEGKVYEKASSREHAFEIISQLQGRLHQVHTGLIVTARKGDETQTWRTVETTAVKFVAMDTAYIECYLDSNEYWDKAGAYGIQTGTGAAIVESIEGCFYNVMGLPATTLCRLIGEALSFLKASD